MTGPTGAPRSAKQGREGRRAPKLLVVAPRTPRHRWRRVEAGELREYGSALKPHRCQGCGIYRFTLGEGRESASYYARMSSGRGRSEVLRRWERAPACPPTTEV